MKITKTQLKQIIKEELNIAIREADEGEEVMAAIEGVPQAAEKIAEKVRSEVEAMAEPSGLDSAVLMQAVAALIMAD
jgi:C4-type Zn-finger protein|tara:strand:- start:74 stop:304 length:231 start_codon:yes stop_codon:yes gene_type:complete